MHPCCGVLRDCPTWRVTYGIVRALQPAVYSLQPCKARKHHHGRSGCSRTFLAVRDNSLAFVPFLPSIRVCSPRSSERHSSSSGYCGENGMVRFSAIQTLIGAFLVLRCEEFYTTKWGWLSTFPTPIVLFHSCFSDYSWLYRLPILAIFSCSVPCIALDLKAEDVSYDKRRGWAMRIDSSKEKRPSKRNQRV